MNEQLLNTLYKKHCANLGFTMFQIEAMANLCRELVKPLQQKLLEAEIQLSKTEANLRHALENKP